ncbi:MAG: metal ABC transporter solute-binding protein, Zn/Mn family [Nesterenkonia sp.]
MPVNPHAWMSPVHAEAYIDNIEAALSEHFPSDAEHFAQNAEEYRQQLRSLHRTTVERFENLDSSVRLVTCEGAFSYLAQEYGIDEHYLWSLNAENEGTAAQTEAQISYVEEHSVPTIFCESTVNDSAQQQVAAETGADLSQPLYVDSLTDDGDVPTYLDLLEHDIDRILSGYE